MKFQIVFPRIAFSYPNANRDEDIKKLGFKIQRDKKASYWLRVEGKQEREFESLVDLLAFLKEWPKARICQENKTPRIKMLGFV